MELEGWNSIKPSYQNCRLNKILNQIPLSLPLCLLSVSVFACEQDYSKHKCAKRVKFDSAPYENLVNLWKKFASNGTGSLPDTFFFV